TQRFAKLRLSGRGPGAGRVRGRRGAAPTGGPVLAVLRRASGDDEPGGRAVRQRAAVRRVARRVRGRAERGSAEGAAGGRELGRGERPSGRHLPRRLRDRPLLTWKKDHLPLRPTTTPSVLRALANLACGQSR